MKLSQIKLSGFKSFVDSLTINISGQLVGIVGPNGCGKSNIIDAIRWVLGESSARQLRGDTMQDVIFNGSISRKAVSRASVELVFLNDGQILSDLWNSYAEISIKRILSRNGESAYYINNQVVRRRDITELFLGTGVGSKGYAVIEQGMINRIIEARPEELRAYLEEAAGVSKYRERRKETVSRLDYTQENLVRLEDICSELQVNIEKLSEQAQVASLYQDLNSELKQLQLTQLVLKIEKAKTSLDDANKLINNYKQELSINAEEIQALQNKLSSEYKAKDIHTPILASLNEEFNQLRFNIAKFEERQKNNYNRKEKVTTESEQIRLQLEAVKNQIEELGYLKQETIIELDLKSDDIIEQQLLRDEKVVSYNQMEQVYIESGRKVTQLSNQLNQIRHELGLINNTINHKKQQLNSLNTRLVKLTQETSINLLDLDQEYTVLKNTLDELELTLEVLLDELNYEKDKKTELELMQAAALEKIHQLKNQKVALETKINTLKQLLAKQNVKFDLSEIAANCDKQLWQALEVEPGYEVAVEIALGHLLPAWPFQTINDILKTPEHLMAFWQVSDRALSAESELSKRVRINDTRFNQIYKVLNQYTVASSLIEAQSLLQKSQTHVITLDGHIVTAEYIIFNANTNNSHILEYQNQINELENELIKIEDELIYNQMEYDDHAASLNTLKHKLIGQEQKYQEQLNYKHKLNLELTKQEQNHLHIKRHQEKVVAEIAILTKDIEFANAEIAKLEDQIEERNLVVENSEYNYEQVQIKYDEDITNFNLIKNELSAFDNKLNQLELNSKLLQQQIGLSDKQISDKKVHIEQLNQQLIILANEKEQLTADTITCELDLAKETINNLMLKIEEEKALIAKLDLTINEYKSQLNKLEQQKSKTQDALNKAFLAQQEHTIVLHNDEENISSLDIKEYNSNEIITNNKLSLNQIQTRITQLKQQIDQMGLVNLKAIEDLGLAQTKYDDLSFQVNDLTNAIALLEQAIVQIDGETRKILNDTYVKVNEMFNVYFKILFGGGGAKLELTDEDILISGLQIFAEPLGKKNSSIYLLSGGEKALTAMSLVFALFNLNPAPFCILDEVDAPLDDANTARFCKLVKELAVKTQFVFISHNRLAMEMAEQLVGVTMQEKGVSTTVSVELIDAKLTS